MPPAGGRWEWTFGGDGAVSPDGRWFISSATDSLKVRRLVLRDLETGGCVRSGHGRGQLSLLVARRQVHRVLHARPVAAPGARRRLDHDARSGARRPWRRVEHGRTDRILAERTQRPARGLPHRAGKCARSCPIPCSATTAFRFLPDGRHFLVGRMEAGSPSQPSRDVARGRRAPARSGCPPRLSRTPTSPAARCSTTTTTSFGRDRSIPRDSSSRARAMTVTTPVTGLINRGHADFSVGGDGTIVFRSQLVRQNDQIVVRDREGRVLHDPDARRTQDLNLSPDGSRPATALKLDRIVAGCLVVRHAAIPRNPASPSIRPATMPSSRRTARRSRSVRTVACGRARPTAAVRPCVCSLERRRVTDPVGGREHAAAHESRPQTRYPRRHHRLARLPSAKTRDLIDGDIFVHTAGVAGWPLDRVHDVVGQSRPGVRRGLPRSQEPLAGLTERWNRPALAP